MKQLVFKRQLVHIVRQSPISEGIEAVVVVHYISRNIRTLERGIVQQISVRGGKIPLRKIYGQRGQTKRQKLFFYLAYRLFKNIRVGDKLHRRTEIFCIRTVKRAVNGIKMEIYKIGRAVGNVLYKILKYILFRYRIVHKGRRAEFYRGRNALYGLISNTVKFFIRVLIVKAEHIGRGVRLVPERKEPFFNLLKTVSCKKMMNEFTDKFSPHVVVFGLTYYRLVKEHFFVGIFCKRLGHKRKLNQRS